MSNTIAATLSNLTDIADTLPVTCPCNS